MRIGNIQFEFERGPTLAVALLLPLLVALGAWQLGRAAEKRALLAGFEAAAAAPAVAYAPQLPRYARVRADGRWDPRQFLLDAQVQAGRTGYRVLTPLELADGSRLIVDRGWVAAGAERAALPEVAIAAVPAAVEGQLDEFPRAGIELADRSAGGAAATPAWPRVALYPSAEAIAAALGAEVQPRLLRLAPDAPDGFARGFEPAAGFPPERHLGYALTWFALAVTLLLLWLGFSRARGG